MTIGERTISLLVDGHSIGKAARILGVPRWQVDQQLEELKERLKCKTLYQLMWFWGYADHEEMKRLRRSDYMRAYMKVYREKRRTNA